MRSFPPSSCLQFFVGKQLERISIALWQFFFSSAKAYICAAGPFEHIDAQGTVHRHNTDEDQRSALYVHHLIGQEIIALSADEFCLTLTFARGDLLRIFSENGPYEDGQIYDEAGELIAVF